MPRGPLEHWKLVRGRNLQSVIKSSSIFQENFVFLTGRKKTKFQSCISLLLTTKFIYLNLILILTTHIFFPKSFFINLLSQPGSILIYPLFFPIHKQADLGQNYFAFFSSTKIFPYLYLLSPVIHILPALHTKMVSLSF